MKTKHVSPVFFLLFFLPAFLSVIPGLHAESIDTAVISFSQLTKAKEQPEQILSGIFYLSVNPSFFAIHLETPVRQIITMEAEKTIVFYPGSSRCLILPPHPDDPLRKQISHLFLEDRGFTQQGFRMESIRMSEEKIISKWLPPQEQSGAISYVEITSNLDEEMEKAVTFTAKGDLLSRVLFSDYTAQKGFSYPLTITTTNYLPTGEIMTESTLSLHHLILNEPLGTQITRFAPPPETLFEDLR